MSSLLSIGTSAVLSYQQALNVTGNNISNASTAGYSRQTVNLQNTVNPGVQVASVDRQYNRWSATQLDSATASNSYHQTYRDYAAQLDVMLGDADTGISEPLIDLQNATQDLANDPTSSAARQAMLSSAEQLASSLNSMDRWLDGIETGVDDAIATDIDQVNDLTASIAELNSAIAAGTANGQQPLDLLDRRDQSINELSSLIDVRVMNEDNGAKAVYLANGQPLVNGNLANRLETFQGGAGGGGDHIALVTANGTRSDITASIQGGEIGARVDFRDDLLSKTRNGLDLLAVDVATRMNAQQARGMDLNGKTGQALFSIADPQVLPENGTTGSIGVTIDAATPLTGDSYQFSYNGGSWTLSDADTGQSVLLSGSGTSADPFVAQGMRITVAPGATAGDSYRVAPTADGAASVSLVMTDADAIAAASPVRSEAAAGNAGSGDISPARVTDINNAVFQTNAGSLSPPLAIVFNGPGSYDLVDNSNPASPVPIETGIAYDPATVNSLFPTPSGRDYGIEVSIRGAPAAGDTFSLAYNTGGTGDNSNALQMASLQSGNTGSTGFSGIYDRLVSDVATRTRQLGNSADAARALYDQAVSRHDAVSGVNLDEEAADLMRYQQGYDAAAQVIAVADELFQTILNVARG